MDRQLVGKEFHLDEKMGLNLALICTVFSYSTAIPDLVALLPLHFFFHYWLDKWEIFKVCKVPLRYNPSLNDLANNILGFAVMVHTAICVWIFTCQTIFPENIKVFQSLHRVQYYYMVELTFLERIFHPSVTVFFLLLIVTFGVFWIVEPLVLEVAKACCFRPPRRGQTIGSNTMRTYSVEVL